LAHWVTFVVNEKNISFHKKPEALLSVVFEKSLFFSIDNYATNVPVAYSNSPELSN
jgi:hypothetical protein